MSFLFELIAASFNTQFMRFALSLSTISHWPSFLIYDHMRYISVYNVYANGLFVYCLQKSFFHQSKCNNFFVYIHFYFLRHQISKTPSMCSFFSCLQFTFHHRRITPHFVHTIPIIRFLGYILTCSDVNNSLLITMPFTLVPFDIFSDLILLPKCLNRFTRSIRFSIGDTFIDVWFSGVFHIIVLFFFVPIRFQLESR